MHTTFFPTVEEALYLHARLIGDFGGTSGVRDLGLLESALTRPRSGYYSSLSEQAAAMMQSLSRNHPFVDGNKRMTFALTAVFLRLNGYSLKVSTRDAERFIKENLINDHNEVKEIAAWLEAHMTPNRK